MSKEQSINSDMAELHDNLNELYEALMDEEFVDVKSICTKAIKKHREIIHLVKKDLNE